MTTPKRRTALRRTRADLTLVGSRLALCCAVSLGSASAQAGWLDGLLAQNQAPGAASKQRSWPIHEFTRIELVPREAGAQPNQHPTTLQPDALRQQLAQIQSVGRNGAQPLFAPDELGELVQPLIQALERAGPGDDVLLLSSARRAGGMFMSPTAVTARLFVQGGQLQFIVHDARLEFYDTYRGTQTAPRFTYGARTGASGVTVRSAAATSTRPDWLAIPLLATAPANAGSPPATLAPPPAVTAAPAPAARKPLDAAGAEDIERRLETLKRLRDKGLISEDEYQQKRKEILQLL